jgi:RNA-directed DNA polymerase
MIIEKMAHELGVPGSFIRSRAHGASHEYKEYYVRKRTGGVRTIHHPSRRLKALQRWLLANVIESLPIHPAATAYRKKHSILDNARTHVASSYLLRMDLENFFPSITQSDVANYIADRSALFVGWTSTDIDAFCRLVCRHSVLTIGAPTSPGLSNAICYDMDVAIHQLCARNGVDYSRYADDLFFSTNRADLLREIEKEVIQVISTLRIPAGLRVNSGKTRHSSKRGARRVTGIVLGSDGQVHVGRAFKRRVRALLHKFASLDAPTRASLAGMIAYAVGFEPEFMNSLISKYGLEAVREATKSRK